MAALFLDRADAGEQLGARLRELGVGADVVVGLARGGVAVAVPVAQALGAELDALAVRKVGHPANPEYAIGAVAPGAGGLFLRARDDLREKQLERAVARAAAAADALDRRLHARQPPRAIGGRRVVLVDDGLATGATMVAAARWARREGALALTVAVPVGAPDTVAALGAEADAVVALEQPDPFGAVGWWYDDFSPVDEDEVQELLDAAAH